jgi:hypothetical protein
MLACAGDGVSSRAVDVGARLWVAVAAAAAL